MTDVRMRWGPAQSAALLDETRYLDIEGAIRSGKTTVGLWKILGACLEHAGIRTLVCRWSEDDAAALLKPLLRTMFEQVGAGASWMPDEHRFELSNGSWVYLRGLRPSENTSRFSKFRGLTLAQILVDQAEEVPEDVILELKGRLSQPGYPPQLILTPNPPGEDHWLAGMFPDTTKPGVNAIENHSYRRLSIYDNAHNLADGYIQALERDYPVGHPMRRRLLDGRRGLNVRGKPVYAGYFERDRHVGPAELVPDVPLVECWDFGHHHPCVLWLQWLPWGELRLLGALMGEDVFLEDFAPLIVQQRQTWFGGHSELWACCDPAGAAENSQGTKKNGVSILKEHGIVPRYLPSANQPDSRDYAIQTTAGYMRRRTFQGEAFRVSSSPRWCILNQAGIRPSSFVTDALEAGYVFDERARRTAGGRSIILPLKDGFYEHVMNCLAGETRVLTDRGAFPIQQLVGTTGRVRSLDGTWQGYQDCRLTRRQAETVCVVFDSVVITCTPDHRFWTPDGWVPASSMAGRQAWRVNSRPHRSRNSLACDITSAMAGIISALASTCIAWSGKLRTVLSRPGIMSITWTAIARTMPLRTWNYFRRATISCTMRARACLGQCLAPPLRRLGSGIARLMDMPGIASITPRFAIAGINQPSAPVITAAWSSWRSMPSLRRATSAVRLAGRPADAPKASIENRGPVAFAGRDSRRTSSRSSDSAPVDAVRCLRVEPGPRTDVYCLDVPTTQMFAVADGILVHNCLEYGTLCYGPARPTMTEQQKATARMERAISKPDRDPYDRRPVTHGRGGW